MNRITRRFATHGYCCAPAMWRSFPCFLLCAATLLAANCGALAIADDLATADLYLQAGSGTVQGPFTGAYDLNMLLGADRFYNAGLTGTNAVMANIEAGYIWNGHETLTHVAYIPTSGGAAGEVDRHATWVGGVMGGRPGGAIRAIINPGWLLMLSSIPAQLPQVGPPAIRVTRDTRPRSTSTSAVSRLMAPIAQRL